MTSNQETVKVAKEIHQIAKSKGWWDEERNEKEIFTLIITELSEAVEADRDNKNANRKEFLEQIEGDNAFTASAWKILFEKNIKDSLEDELADAFIRCLDYLFFKYTEDWHLPSLGEYDFSDNFAENIFDITALVIDRKIGKVANAILQLSNELDIDLEWHVEKKMQYNRLRPKKHGGKKY